MRIILIVASLLFISQLISSDNKKSLEERAKQLLEKTDFTYSIDSQGFIVLNPEGDEPSFLYFTSDFVKIRGYSGYTDVAVFLNNDLSIKEIEIFESEDTPSFVRRLKSKRFLNQFNGDVSTKNFKIVTGATITSNVVIQSVKESMEIVASRIRKKHDF